MDMSSALKWLYEKCIRCLQFSVTKDCGKVFDTVALFLPLIDSIVLAPSVHEHPVIAQFIENLQVASKIVSLKTLGEVDFEGLLADASNQLRNLRELHGPHSSAADSWYIRLLNNNPNIQSIELFKVSEMSNSLIEALVKLPKLQDLSLSFMEAGSCAITITALATGHFYTLRGSLYLEELRTGWAWSWFIWCSIALS